MVLKGPAFSFLMNNLSWNDWTTTNGSFLPKASLGQNFEVYEVIFSPIQNPPLAQKSSLYF